MDNSEDQEDKKGEADFNEENSLIVMDIIERLSQWVDGIERHV